MLVLSSLSLPYRYILLKAIIFDFTGRFCFMYLLRDVIGEYLYLSYLPSVTIKLGLLQIILSLKSVTPH
jgi:hypothetical protein